MTRSTIQKISEDYNMLSKAWIIISIKIYVKYVSRNRVLIVIMS
jgi:hypothetical protein